MNGNLTIVEVDFPLTVAAAGDTVTLENQDFLFSNAKFLHGWALVSNLDAQGTVYGTCDLTVDQSVIARAGTNAKLFMKSYASLKKNFNALDACVLKNPKALIARMEKLLDKVNKNLDPALEDLAADLRQFALWGATLPDTDLLSQYKPLPLNKSTFTFHYTDDTLAPFYPYILDVIFQVQMPS